MPRWINSEGWSLGEARFGYTSVCVRDIFTAASDIKYYRGIGEVIGVTSGGFDPIRPGHISCILDASRECHQLWVIVNGDEFIRRKKGEKEPFQPIKVRAQNVAALKGVTVAVPFDATDPSDLTVSEALEILKPNKFFKGGDRNDIENLPEAPTCRKYGIEIVTGMGDNKYWSSSDFLRKWDERKK